jgi:hypothetical protein
MWSEIRLKQKGRRAVLQAGKKFLHRFSIAGSVIDKCHIVVAYVVIIRGRWFSDVVGLHGPPNLVEIIGRENGSCYCHRA